MVIDKIAYRGLIWIVLLLGFPLGAAAGIGPKAQVLETTYDFGKVFEDRELKHTFEIKNIGDAVLEITDIDSGRMMIHIRQSKFNKDRYVPLSPLILAGPRKYYYDCQGVELM